MGRIEVIGGLLGEVYVDVYDLNDDCIIEPPDQKAGRSVYGTQCYAEGVEMIHSYKAIACPNCGSRTWKCLVHGRCDECDREVEALCYPG